MSAAAVRRRLITIVRSITPTVHATEPFVCEDDANGARARLSDAIKRDAHRAFDLETRSVRPTQHTGTGAAADVVHQVDVRVAYAGPPTAHLQDRIAQDEIDILQAVVETPANWSGDFDFARPAGDTSREEVEGGVLLRVPLEIGYAG